MLHKIAVNGFGRLDRLALLAQAIPLMPPKARRVFEDGIESLKDVINEADKRSREQIFYSKANIREYKLRPPESNVTDVMVNTSDLPNARYHDRTFPKDYYKRKKARRRQQKLSRHRK